MPVRKTILIAPLYWGLGHATRCIPMIRELLKSGYKVIIASDGEALSLLQKEFPELESLELPSYNIKYSKRGRNLKWLLFKKLPNLLRVIRQEKEVIEDLISEGKINGIISDNRFGVYSSKVPSVYLTHQLNVLSGNTTLITSKRHQRIIRNNFNECWIPDHKGSENLSGDLGHLSNSKIPLKYIGVLSRMKKKELPKRYDVLFLLSGPEPQREYLEKIIINNFRDRPSRSLLVRGVVEKNQAKHMTGNIEVVNYMLSDALENVLNSTDLVISRSGYTSIMDLAALEKKAYFIPTPGQFEQEYLAKRCKELGMAPYCNQKDFSYDNLQELYSYKGLKTQDQKTNYQELFALFEGK